MTDLEEIHRVGVDEHIDGRTLRRSRNRDAVITALLDLVREGDLRPGAAEVADRAGVSHRSIFRYFDDLDDLVRTAIDHAFAEAAPYIEIPAIGSGAEAERVAAFVDARLALLEHIDGIMRVARIRSASIPAIDEALRGLTETFRDQIAQQFAVELDAAGTDAPMLSDAVLVLTGHDSYTTHTQLLGNDRDHIRAAWVTAITALLN